MLAQPRPVALMSDVHRTDWAWAAHQFDYGVWTHPERVGRHGRGLASYSVLPLDWWESGKDRSNVMYVTKTGG